VSRKRVRVLHVARGLGLGGTEKTMQLLACALDRSRFEPIAYSFADGERARTLREAGVPTHIGVDLLELLLKLSPDIVHLHRAGWPEPELMRTLRLARVPRVVETNVFGRPDPSPGAAIIDRHIFVSRFCLERYAEDAGLDPEDPRLTVLYNPVDTDFYASYPWSEEKGRVFGRLSRPDPGKWSPLAVEMLPHLARLEPDFRYLMVGGIPEAKDYVKSHGFADRVEFLEPLQGEEEIAAFFDGIALLAHANDAGESFGLCIAEAMAAGLPVVTHPAAGRRDNAQLELVEHGVTGFVAATAEDYARAVARLLQNPGEAQAMGEAGRAKAARLFGLRGLARQLENIYQGLLEPAYVASGNTGSPSSLCRLHQGGARL
jgi:glycosyltransferase involved in cell wall biosynthesis